MNEPNAPGDGEPRPGTIEWFAWYWQHREHRSAWRPFGELDPEHGFLHVCVFCGRVAAIRSPRCPQLRGARAR